MNASVPVTARGIVVRGQDLLLMERWRDGTHYYSIPGGHVESGETFEQTVIREIEEETTIRCAVVRPVLELHRETYRHIVFECVYRDGEPAMPDSAEEALRTKNENLYKPQWVRIDILHEIPFGYWEPLKMPLIQGLKSGFSRDVAVVTL